MWVLALKLGKFGEILGKYCILDESSVGSKGLRCSADRVPRSLPAGSMH